MMTPSLTPAMLMPFCRRVFFFCFSCSSARVLLLLLLALLDVDARPQPPTSGTQTSLDPAGARRMIEFKTEMIKSKILREVNLLEPPMVTEPVSVSEDVLKLFESKDIEESILGEGDNLIAYPVNDDISCENITSCSRYEYELPADNKLSFVHLWIQKTEPNEPMDMNVCVAYSADVEDPSCELLKNVTEVKIEKGWEIYELPRRLVSESYGDQLLCTVEIIGPSTTDHQKPFLVASRNNESEERRRRRSAGGGGSGGGYGGGGTTSSSTTKNCTCCLVDFQVSFEDIDWHWVVAPKKFNAYMCYGKCSSQINSYRSNYHQMVHTVNNINKTVVAEKKSRSVAAEEAAWTPCCSPTKLSSLNMIYVEGNSTVTNSTKTSQTYIYHKIPNMITESCGCW